MSKFKIGDRVIVGVRDGAVVSMEHADTRSTKLVGVAHDAIDRLVTELERRTGSTSPDKAACAECRRGKPTRQPSKS